jgi:hypothetical protein
MGMIHEHQRADAGSYVHFECSNLADYEDVKKAVEKQGKDKMEGVCKGGKLAVKYASMANDWRPELYGFGQVLKARLGLFDLKSIM